MSAAPVRKCMMAAVCEHGLITTPHAVAKTPDYYLTGDDIHIYPGEKWTSENTALWFKHICLSHMVIMKAGWIM